MLKIIMLINDSNVIEGKENTRSVNIAYILRIEIFCSTFYYNIIMLLYNYIIWESQKILHPKITKVYSYCFISG